jgi:hypothetical protein
LAFYIGFVAQILHRWWNNRANAQTAQMGDYRLRWRCGYAVPRTEGFAVSLPGG